MSEPMSIALISFTSAMIAAVIGAIAMIAAAFIKSSNPGWKIIGLVSSITGIAGLLLGIVLSVILIQGPSPVELDPELIIELNNSVCSREISSYPGNYISEENLPEGSTYSVTVNDGEIHAITAGTVRIRNTYFQGGIDRGSVIVMLPGATYHFSELIPRNNWHGAFILEQTEINELINVLVANFKKPGNCSDGDGCSVVDVLVIDPEKIVFKAESKAPFLC